jgi:hypothetical protein
MVEHVVFPCHLVNTRAALAAKVLLLSVEGADDRTAIGL